MCAVASGSWGGRCLSLADYVTVRRSSDGGARRRRVLKLPTLQAATVCDDHVASRALSQNDF